jgi:hypothetical protein
MSTIDSSRLAPPKDPSRLDDAERAETTTTFFVDPAAGRR